MNKRNSITFCLNVAMLLVLLTSFTSAQNNIGNQEWKKFFSTDKRFSIDLPGNLKHIDDAPIEKTFFKCTKSVDYYGISIPPNDSEYKFGIVVIDVSGCKRDKNLFNKEITRFFKGIGGDDKRVLKDSIIMVNGLPAHEFIYENGPEISGRSLAVDAGDRIFLLNYDKSIGEKTEEDRIFNSFRPRKKS